ncbi:MAG: saccharopine dehydrogenase NADP-binding domain-containing protein [Alkalispirochaeta sp.]
MEREFDICLHGATGFTGRLVAHHLARRCREEGMRWAISGRNPGRLAALVDELGAAGDAPEVIVADSGDPAALDQLAARCRVVCSTVGPYARFGTELVRSCVEQGASYLDLTGEVHWMRAMIDQFGDAADRAGVAIVHASGFDSIPSDIGVLVARGEARRRHGEEPRALRLQVERMAGGVSRGTLDSMVALVQEALRSRDVRAIITDPRSLTPGWSAGGAGAHTGTGTSVAPGPAVLPPAGAGRSPAVAGRSQRPRSQKPRYRHRLPSGQWVMPFFMDTVNGRVVRRSIALSAATASSAGSVESGDLGWSGELPAYREVVCTGTGLRGFVRAMLGRVALTALKILIMIPPTRLLLQKTVFPAPGGGPDEEQRGRGNFRITIHDEEREEALVTIEGNRDPGYGATAIMLGEAALLLASDTTAHQSGRPSGVITPAIAFGARIVPHLAEHGIVIAPADITPADD